MTRESATGGGRRGRARSPARVLGVVFVVAIVGSALAVPAAAQRGPTNATFVVRQGGTCTQLTPLGDGTETVSSFYDYRSTVTDPEGLYSSYGTRDIQLADTSQVFVYNGSDGLSLVFLTDKLGSESGGSTYTTDISGLPVDGKWVVEDDTYNHNDDTFQTNVSGGRHAHFVQVQNGNRTDGAAFLGLGGGAYRTVRIRIRFNQYSAVYPYDKWQGTPAENHVDRWVARSGDGTTTALDMTRPITLAPGTCSGGVEPNPRSANATTRAGANETETGPYVPASADVPGTLNPNGPPLTVSTNGSGTTMATPTSGGTVSTATSTSHRPTTTTPMARTATGAAGTTAGETTATAAETTPKSNATARAERTDTAASGGGTTGTGDGFAVGGALVALLVGAVLAARRR